MKLPRFSAALGLTAIAAVAVVAAAAMGESRQEITDEVDRLVLAHFDRIQPRSIRNNAEYCGLVGYDATGALAVTPATRGGTDHCDPAPEPDGFEVIASYHTHGAATHDADTEVPSADDLLGDFEDGIDGYVATPSGRVWLNLVEEQRTVLLCGPGCVSADPAFQPCPALPPGEEHTVESLRRREVRDTGEC